MKRRYTRDTIDTFIKGLDVRAKDFDKVKLDNVINRGYAELSTVTRRVFSNEEVLELEEYYNTQDSLVIDIDEDVTEVYDVYLTLEGERDKSMCQDQIQDVGIYRNNNVAYRDNRHVGRVHVKLDALDTKFDTVIVKYYFTPEATTDEVYMDSQTYLAWTDAMWAATCYFLKDIEGETQKRASMTRTAASIKHVPEDVPQRKQAIFGRPDAV